MDFEQRLKQFIANAIEEDRGEGDHTSMATIADNKQAKAQMLVKEDGILAGIEVAAQIFKEIDADLEVELLSSDGASVKKGDIVLNVSGGARSILLAERLVLNTMQRMSGIATLTHQITTKIQHTSTKLLDTRKTTPNFRFLEKLAVKIGGGVNHRFGLFDMILIKDNHVDTAGGIKQALDATAQYLNKINKAIPVEIEVRNFDELQEVLQWGKVDRILLDNFSPSDMKVAVEKVDKQMLTEASGNINAENVLAYAESGVDYISMGCLTHSVKSLDLSLKVVMV